MPHRMKAFQMNPLLMIIIGLMAITSCAPFPHAIMKEADRKLSIGQVQENPDLYKGKTILWGGVIVTTENRPEETRIVIMQTALDIETRPENLDRSEGRFILKHNGFLDPVIYAQGRLITVAGKVAGKEDLLIGEVRYAYPIIVTGQFVLWEKPTSYPAYFYDPWYWNRFPYRGHYHRR